MITQNILPALLLSIGFTKKGDTYKKKFAAAELEVNFATGKIIYPEVQGLIINERQTCNFSSNENFVVLECVHRLLEKGYQPQHIELEPKWKVGHGSSGGRADILVKDNAGRGLLLIECKTSGTEFKRAWNKTLQDGDQLFSYAHQISETQFLCLYASEFGANQLTYQSHLIAHRDNPEYLEDKPEFKSFASCTNAKERFTVWRDTYKLDFRTQGLFEPNIQPYHVGKDKYTLADLKAVSDNDRQKKYHEFATILRQHNVSGRENAFDKLINLFLCKLVDETENPQELKFYWKGVAFDTHFNLLDRLQQLYQRGMGKFLGETITYIDEGAVKSAMRHIRANPDATQKAVWQLFLQQKFFTNNDFSLIDVHNEKLFYQNADVLLKILQLWQDIRLTGGNSQNQFLGDMFEFFLDQGVKQSEGQYFTPMPICRFILMSLPLDSMVKGSAAPLKAIDYACGSGHFLNELALQLNPLVLAHKGGDTAQQVAHLKAQHSAIVGIEKEYRLSKVAKVSAFMYGQQDIKICYGDALVQQHNAFPDIQNGTFDLLVANPPYSVRGFLETLSEKERAVYELSDAVDKLDSNNSIETFFIERAKQLLKGGGVAAIVLPSSILSNGGGVYVATREIVLKYFDIVAIAELGSGTFGKTGTNTVTLFLRRKATQPDAAEHYLERVNDWFASAGASAGDDGEVMYQDQHLLAQYAAHIGVPLASYTSLLAGELDGPWASSEYFDAYAQAFKASADFKKPHTQKAFKALSAPTQKRELQNRYLKYVHVQEREKLYYFVLASSQSHPVLVIKSPSETKAIKAFLGYDWSTSKGDEGIKLIKNAKGQHVTALYDETDRSNAAKLNLLINDNFEGKLSPIPDAMSGFAHSVRLVDMLDFSRAVCEKQIVLTSKQANAVVSKWPMQSIGQLCSMKAGGTPSRTNQEYWGAGVKWLKISDFKDFDLIQETDESITQEGLDSCAAKMLDVDTVVVTIFATIGRVGLVKVPMATNQAIVGLTPKTNNLTPYYLMNAVKFCVSDLLAEASGMAQDNINQTKLSELKIPIPPLEVQKNIVNDCEALDVEVAKAHSVITAKLALISSNIADCFKTYQAKPLQDICDIKRGRFSHRPRNDPRFFEGPYPFIQTGDVVRAVASKVSYTQTLNEEGLAVSKLFQPPVVLVTIAANIGDTAVLDYPACFTDSVVGLIPGRTIEARFLELMMRAQKQHLNDIAPQMAQKNINIEILKPIKVPVPALAVQKRFVADIEKLEKLIADAQVIIAAAPAKKQAVMKRYL